MVDGSDLSPFLFCMFTGLPHPHPIKYLPLGSIDSKAVAT